MLASPDALNIAAKRLAMLAKDHVSKFAAAITGHADYSGDVSGAVLGIMPHIVEKAILTSSALPADVAVRLCKMFVDEYASLVKIISNVGGFSNPIKKTLFNSTFQTMFQRGYDTLRPIVDKFWEMGQFEQSAQLTYVAYLTLKRVEDASGFSMDDEAHLEAASMALHDLFDDVHAMLSAT